MGMTAEKNTKRLKDILAQVERKRTINLNYSFEALQQISKFRARPVKRP
jgi:hypothetical protein